MASTKTTKLFADNLQELIAKSGKSMKDLATEIGISAAALSKYQNDGAAANIDALVKIAKYFNVTTDWLLGYGEIMRPDPDKIIAHEYTKLSEEALAWLHKIQDSKKIKFVSMFLEDELFQEMVLSNIEKLKEVYFDGMIDLYAHDLPQKNPRGGYFVDAGEYVVLLEHRISECLSTVVFRIVDPERTIKERGLDLG